MTRGDCHALKILQKKVGLSPWVGRDSGRAEELCVCGMDGWLFLLLRKMFCLGGDSSEPRFVWQDFEPPRSLAPRLGTPEKHRPENGTTTRNSVVLLLLVCCLLLLQTSFLRTSSFGYLCQTGETRERIRSLKKQDIDWSRTSQEVMCSGQPSTMGFRESWHCSWIA